MNNSLLWVVLGLSLNVGMIKRSWRLFYPLLVESFVNGLAKLIENIRKLKPIQNGQQVIVSEINSQNNMLEINWNKPGSEQFSKLMSSMRSMHFEYLINLRDLTSSVTVPGQFNKYHEIRRLSVMVIVVVFPEFNIIKLIRIPNETSTFLLNSYTQRINEIKANQEQ